MGWSFAKPDIYRHMRQKTSKNNFSFLTWFKLSYGGMLVVKIKLDFTVRDFIFMLKCSYACVSLRNTLKTIFECELLLLSVLVSKNV